MSRAAVPDLRILRSTVAMRKKEELCSAHQVLAMSRSHSQMDQ